ncbi:DUF86 domain-containing protein [Rhizobium sp. TRM95111]|uniref:HepT-like ribonuclease domain-containing protein n=1 Tax=Rhizobium alarense TaxID=2846851 RepID=UPI001F1C8C31|nr:HepT-like ribonuclease domain-containing protein [Rhizobium alarense]MCF3640622.1 DUF86 domain-containing protein [Rhizobium alarense]
MNFDSESNGTGLLPSSRPKTRLCDIAENGTRILAYTAGLDLDAFRSNVLRRDATERCILRISEAATKLDSRAEELLPDHPWRRIRDVANVLRHLYDQVDAEILRDIVTKQLPPLLADIERILPDLPEDFEV